MSTFLLIRHGNTTVGDRIPGRSAGIHLSESGKQQAVDLAERLASVPISAIYCSPLERTRETAEPLARKKGLPAMLLDDLVEIEFGEWTNVPFDALESVPQWKLFHTFRSGTPIPSGEFVPEVQSRMVTAIDRLRREFPDALIALFSHADPIRAAIAYYAGVPLDFMLRLRIDTGSVSSLYIDQYGAALQCLNHTGAVPYY